MTAIFAVLAVTCAFAAVLAAVRAASAHSEAERDAATLAADRLSTNLTAITTAVAGGDGLAVDGEITDAEFGAFARDVLETTGVDALALGVPVADDDLAAWESATRLQVKDTDGRGGFVETAPRPVHVVVRAVEPVAGNALAVLGFDIMSDPVRSAGVVEANARQTTALVGPISLASSGRPGMFIITAVRDQDEEVVGYVSSGIALDQIIDQLTALAGVGAVGISVDGSALTEAQSAGASASFTLADRVFTVRATSDDQASSTLPIILGIGAIVFAVAAGVTGRRELDASRRERRAVARSGQLATLAEELVNAGTTATVLDTLVDRAGAVVDARYTNVGRRLESDPTKLRVVHDEAMADGLAERFALQSLDDDMPLPEAARTGNAVFIGNRHDYQVRYPHVLPQVQAAGIHAVYCVPLSLAHDGSVGALGFAFDRELDERDCREIETAAALVSQMAGRAFDRAFAREVIQERVDRLAEFARSLTTARTSADVAESVALHLPPLLDLDVAEVSTEAPAATRGTHALPLDLPDGGFLVLHRHGSAWTSIDETLAVTVGDLVGGALTRTRSADQERTVLSQLQESLLMPPPDVDGFDIGVGYRSAVVALGMGGDWYSVIDTDAALYAVIGDVAGHGAGAVAQMAEVKTIMRHLLANHTPIAETMEQAHRALARRGAYGSAAIVRIDKRADRLDYVNAGHPPSVHFVADGEPVLLDVVHRPWLGVRGTAAADGPFHPTSVEFSAGDLLVMYTDGLVEERGRSIDASIRNRLFGIDSHLPAAALIDGLITARLRQPAARAVDDDLAAVAIKRIR